MLPLYNEYEAHDIPHLTIKQTKEKILKQKQTKGRCRLVEEISEFKSNYSKILTWSIFMIMPRESSLDIRFKLLFRKPNKEKMLR